MCKGFVFLALLVACTVVQSAEDPKQLRPSAAPATLQVITVPGRPGETCVILVGANKVPLMRRCTYRYLSG